ncbi:MAG: ferrous iron transport protein A [Bacilli bacterium]|jgi:ferrous iron transport protein A|nr:ferrous iron transport protein A [Bacilli bacterium]MCH4202150.1 ferrous iron transport protein A [Bacilli bacterium]
MPLVIAPLNQKLKVFKILADGKIKKHLESLGITINSEIVILSRSGKSVICQIKEGRLGIDEGIATRILVNQEA